VSWLIQLHDMAIIGLEGVWPLLIGTVALTMTISGACMLARILSRQGGLSLICRNNSHDWTLRSAHRLIAAIILIPFTAVIITGEY
jgi:uncharacterized iron-regulated membrane protein